MVGGAVGELLRQVFLHHHLGVQVHVGGGIGDAEAALAEHGVDAVFEQAEADRQDQVGRRRLGVQGAPRVVGCASGHRLGRRDLDGEIEHGRLELGASRECFRIVLHGSPWPQTGGPSCPKLPQRRGET
jgi:hypothetical protein